MRPEYLAALIPLRGSVHLEPGGLRAAGHPPVVDLVAVQRSLPAAQHLVGREHDVSVQHPHRLDPARPAFDRVVDRPAQHLEATANAQHGPTRGSMRANGLVQAPLPHPAQIGDGGFGTRQHDHVGIGQVGGFPDPAHQHAGFAGQRLDVGGVGDPGQPQHRDPKPLVAARRSRCAQYAVRQYRDRVLGVEPQVVGVGQHPVGGTAAEFGELAQPGFQQRDVAAELVHDESGDQRLITCGRARPPSRTGARAARRDRCRRR